MKKKLLQLVLLLAVTAASAQTPEFKAPDYDLIKSNIENKDSNLYYKGLLEKFHSKDTLMTKDEYLHLYYGTILQKDYEPYGRGGFDDKLSKYYQDEDLSEKERKEFIELANKSLKKVPIDMRLLDYLAYVYQMDGNEAMARKISHNFNGLFDAILSTGDGLTCETGFHVISISHEYMVLSIFQLRSTSQALVDTCDYLEFEKGKYKIDGMYFDVAKLLEKNLEKFRD